MTDENHPLGVAQGTPDTLLKLADRIDATKRSWLPIAGHVVNVTFDLGEADTITASLRFAAGANALASQPPAAPVEPYPELLMAREALKAMLSLFDDEGNMIATFDEMQKAVLEGYDVLGATKPSYEIKSVSRSSADIAPDDVRLEQALYEAQCYGIGATSDTNQRVILQAAKALAHIRAQPQTSSTSGDEMYEIGKRDGYEDAIQELDMATGGDGEFRGSTIPGRTVDVEVMKERIIARCIQ